MDFSNSRHWNRSRLLTRVGHMEQLASIRRAVLAEGPGKGVEIAEVSTGTGFRFTVLLDRGMDIHSASYHGVSLAWLSPSGEPHPSRFDDKGLGWLRTFPGGLVTTCGLTQTGAPCRDGNEDLGLHGRYTSLPAENISKTATWEGNRYVLRLSGEMRQAVLFGENLLLRREIETRLGDSGFILRDTVTNEGSRPTPHMILYHCNFGFPLLDEKTVLRTPHSRIEPRDEAACQGLADALRFGPPRRGYREKVFFHELRADRKGRVTVELFNPALFGGLGVAIRYSLRKLPYFTQWKMLGPQEYVCGLEPGNALVLGRAAERAAGRLVILKPGESRRYELEFTVRKAGGEAAAPEDG